MTLGLASSEHEIRVFKAKLIDVKFNNLDIAPFQNPKMGSAKWVALAEEPCISACSQNY